MEAGSEGILKRTRQVVDETVRIHAGANDREARFPREGVEALGRIGALGLALPVEVGGLGLGPRSFANVTSLLAEADASLAMVYVMHVCGALCIGQASRNERLTRVLQQAARGEHLTTLAFSEKGSRSHFWAPVSRAVAQDGGVRLTAQKSWVTSAGEADSYVVISQSPESTSPLESTLYLVDGRASGLRVLGPWEGMGLRGNSSSPVILEEVHVAADGVLTPDGKAFDVLLSTVLPWFNLGAAAISEGICRGAVDATVEHLRTSRLEHLGQSLAEAYPTLRARLARMRSATDQLAAMVAVTADQLEHPCESTMTSVLEVKAVANETALAVTSDAMRACGGAAFSRHTSIDRYFRDAQAGAVMAPTVDQLHEFLGRSLVGLPIFGPERGS